MAGPPWLALGFWIDEGFPVPRVRLL